MDPAVNETSSHLQSADMSGSHRSGPGGASRRLLLGASLVLIAFNLRPLFSSASALLPEIRSELGLGAVGAGLLTTLPVVCLGAFSPLAPRLAQRLGTERTLLAVVLM
ncbi:MAG: cyanate transporter, partial [Pseudomonadota bacterium]|nr:cyanate transporter [Pseudomonadota bacterium]